MQSLTQYLMPLLALTCEMAPYLLLGFLLAGVLHVFVPRKIYSLYLSKNDFRSVMLSALFGVPLPLCSCGVIPTAMSMRKEGASKAATVSFLISTPQTGVDSIAATASLLGGAFAVIRPVVAFITAIFGGLFAGAFDKGDDTETTVTCAENDEKIPSGFWAKCREALKYGFSDMIADIGKNLVIGLLIAGAISILLPDDFFSLFADRPLLNMLLVLLISAPMYLCATGSVPIAAALMLKGLTPGAALVLLMAGPATNMASIIVIGKVLGRRTLIIYMASIIIGALGFGAIIDYLLPADWFAVHDGHVAACCHATADIPMWKSLCAYILLALLAAAFIRNHKHSKTTVMGKSFKIKGMSCSHCKANVEKAIAAVEGVTSVTVDLQSGTADVQGDVAPEAVVAAVTAAGYECKAL